MTAPDCPSYAGYRFPAEIISHAVWRYFRFPLSLRHVDALLAARGIAVSHETVRQWGLKSGQAFATQITGQSRVSRTCQLHHGNQPSLRNEHRLFRIEASRSREDRQMSHFMQSS